MMDLKGKKLLLFGGINHAMEIIKAAHEMGVLVYVTDYNKTSPAKLIADKAFTVSTTDIDAVVALCKSEGIDGIITGFIDSMLPYCAEVCKRLGMPFWATKEQLDICSIKDHFKEKCRQYGIPVIEEYHVTDTEGELDFSKLDDVKFPVLVKPVDNSGSRGIYVCHDIAELVARFSDAKSFSKSGRVLVEQYVEGQHVNMYYTLSDGDVVLSAMADRYVDYLDGLSAPLPVKLIHPSNYLDEYEATIDIKVKNMFNALGMKHGVAFIQGFRCNDGSFVVYEMGYRLNGGGTYAIIDAFQGYNQLKSLIHFSLTGKMGDAEMLLQTTPHYNEFGVNYVVSSKIGGGIADIQGLETVKKFRNVIRVIQVRFAGEQIIGKGGSAQIIAYVLFRAKNQQEIQRTIDAINSVIKITTKENENELPP